MAKLVLLRRKRSPVAHILLTQVASAVEFWCGHEGDFEDLLLPTSRSRTCRACRAYRRNGIRYGWTGTSSPKTEG